MSGVLKVQSLRKSAEIHPNGKWTCPNCGTKHEHPHWEDHQQKQKVDKNFAKTGVKNQMVRMSWMKTIFRSRSIAPNVIGKKIVCCS
jgi:uncharacterized Zn finger protein (UPF0148 family)